MGFLVAVLLLSYPFWPPKLGLVWGEEAACDFGDLLHVSSSTPFRDEAHSSQPFSPVPLTHRVNQPTNLLLGHHSGPFGVSELCSIHPPPLWTGIFRARGSGLAAKAALPGPMLQAQVFETGRFLQSLKPVTWDAGISEAARLTREMDNKACTSFRPLL